MLFNSWDFAVFFVIVLLSYWRLPHNAQNWFLLAASYIFYGWWDARFLGLLALSTFIDHSCALAIHRSQQPTVRRWILLLSLGSNLVILGFFKYWNFFTDGLEALLTHLGVPAALPALRIILPMGISFYTFQTMSYVIDVYRAQLVPERRLRDFALFVAFFPQLVAGPIERAGNLLPQITAPRRLDLARFQSGCYLILWGLFEKIFIADNLAPLVERVFAPAASFRGLEVLGGAYAFALQILCDFDGYSNIARGTAWCLGFTLMENFRRPYLATNPSEFWRRWHISLSTWLRDYLYIPLGGNRGGLASTCCNLLLTMVLGGLWHGAAWTFVCWGVYHGLLLVLYRLSEPWRSRWSWRPPGGMRHILKGCQILGFFHLVCLGWLIFRAPSLGQAWAMLQSVWLAFAPRDLSALALAGWKPLAAALILLTVYVRQIRTQDSLAICRWPFVVRWGWYTLVFHLLVCFGPVAGRQFIYFQF